MANRRFNRRLMHNGECREKVSAPTKIMRGVANLNGKTLPATAGAGRIGVIEGKTFSIQTTGKLQRGIEQVQKALQVGDYFHAIVLKDLVGWPGLVIKIHLVGQPRTTTGDHAHPDKEVVAHFIGLTDLGYLFLGTICYENHNKVDKG